MYGTFGALLAPLLPGVPATAEPAKASPMVSTKVLANGPFVSQVFKVIPELDKGYMAIRVKYGNTVADFYEHGLPEDMRNAEKFMRSAGCDEWLLTDELKKELAKA